MSHFQSNWPWPDDYSPVPIGNGTQCLQLDPRCSMEQRQFCRNICLPSLVRTGYRYNDHAKSMVRWGHFITYDEAWGEPLEVVQELHAREGVVVGTSRYGNGLTVHYTAFCCLTADFFAIKLSFEGGDESIKPFFRYFLSAPRLAVSIEDASHGILHYALDGMGQDLTGHIGVFGSDGYRFSHDGMEYRLDFAEREAVIYLAFGDEAIATAKSSSFDTHLAAQTAAWAAYFAQGYVTTPDERCTQACDTALYYLKVVTTPWSIPTALIPSHWECRYFCFDEFFSLLALLKTGHLAEALHVPEFRLQVLPQAQRRFWNYNIEDGPAHYPWESAEDGLEATSDGFWLDHIFEHGHVVLSCYECWKYSGDDALAARYYPVMRACVKYFLASHIYNLPGSGAHVGFCTDLERLGPAKFNPYMTCCSVIAALRATAETARHLGRDLDDCTEWERIADELKRNLPQNDERYLAYPEAKDTAIGMFSGLHPYNVIDKFDPKQLAAVRDFLSREAEYGIMMAAMGKGICTWYSAWKALFFERRGERAEGSRYMLETVASTGHHGETFENNRTLRGRPWFATGSAAVLQCVAESLFQVEGDELKIAPACPANWQDFEFLLAIPNDCKLHCKMENGRVTKLDFICGSHCLSKEYTIVLPNGSKLKQRCC